MVDNITEDDLEKGDSGYMEAKEKVKKAENFVAPGSAHSFSMPGRRLSPWIFFITLWWDSPLCLWEEQRMRCARLQSQMKPLEQVPHHGSFWV